jgi:hypothetical protein
MRLKTMIAALFSVLYVSNVRADECDLQARSIAGQIGASIGTRANGIIALLHPAASEMDYGCPLGAFLAMFARQGGEASLPGFYDLIEEAGRAFPYARLGSVRDAARQCIMAATSEPSGYTRLQYQGVTLDCGAGPAAGGITKVTIEAP